MPDIQGNRKKVYGALAGMGFTGIGKDADEFSSLMDKEENRKKVYDALSSKGFTGIGKDYNEFSSLIYSQPLDKSQYTFTAEQLGLEETPYQFGKSADKWQNMSSVVAPMGDEVSQMQMPDIMRRQEMPSENRHSDIFVGRESERRFADAAQNLRKARVDYGVNATEENAGVLENAAKNFVKVEDMQRAEKAEQQLRDEGKLRRGVKAGFEKEKSRLYRGAQHFVGEAANLLTGSSLEAQDIIERWDELTGLRNDATAVVSNSDANKIKHINELVKELGSLEAAKEEIEWRANYVTWGDRQIQEASRIINNYYETEGVGAWVGGMIPQMIPAATGMLVSAITKSPTAAKWVGRLGLGGMSMSTAGQSMKEARDYGADNWKVWAVGLGNGAIEMVTEAIPYNRYTKRIANAVGAKVGQELSSTIVNNPSAREELEKLLVKANKELGGNLLGSRNVKDYLTDVAAEGASEFTAEALQTITPMLYQNPEDYPTLWEVVKNGWEGAKGGIFMGSILGGVSKGAEYYTNDQRRKTQGYVRVAEVNDGKNVGIGEVVGEREGKNLVMLNGEVIEVAKDKMGEEYTFSYPAFKNAENLNMQDISFEQGYNTEPTGVNALNAMTGYDIARQEVARALGLAEGDDVDVFLNGRTAEDIANGDEVIEDAVNNYLAQKARMEGIQEKFQQTREQQYEESDRSIDKFDNNGMVYATQYEGDPVYITGGNVVLNEDGTIDVNNSSETLYVKFPDGHVEMISPDKFTEVFTEDKTADLKAAKRAEIDQRWRTEFDTAEAQSVEQEKREAGVVFNKTDAQGEHRIEVLNEGDDMSDILMDGNQVQIPTEELNRWKQEAGIQTESAVADDTTDNGTPTESEANVAPTGDNVAPVTPVELPDVPDFFRLGGKNYSVASRNTDGSVDVIVDGKRETLPAGTDYSSLMPTDKKGDVIFTAMPVERTHEYFMQKVTNDKARALMIEKNRKKAEAERKKFDKDPDVGLDPDKWEEDNRKWEEGKKAAQAKVDYWNEVAKRDAEITRSETREAVENIKPDVVEETADEFIANQLEGIKITPESFKRETGLSNAEQAQLVGVISNDGVSVERAAEIITENYDSELKALGFTGDMQDVRDIIIDVLSQGNPRSYARKGREVREAENVDQQRAEAEAWARGAFDMTLEELYLYEETLLPRMMRDYEGFDENEYYSNLAENNGYDTTRESESIGRSGELLQGEQSVPAGGTPVVGQRNEGGAVHDDVQGGGQNGVAQEEAINEPVGNSEQLSSSEIPNNQSVAEGNAPGQSGVYADNQGNPVDADGKLIVDEVNSIDEITDEDFETPTRNVQLPAIPENVANAIGTNGRPVVIKRNVFEKNGNTHVELEPEDSRNILRSALYNPNLVGSTQPIRRPDYKVAIRTGEQNAVVVLDVYQEKDFVEIVGWRMVNEKGLAKMQRQAEREGGQFLILSPNDGSAAALSALPLGLSSASEDRNSVSNSQENTQKSGEIAENGGEKKSSIIEEAEAEYRNNPLHGVQFSIDADAYNNEDVTFGESEQSTEGGALVSYQDVIYKGQTIGWVKETQSGRMFAPMVTSFYVPLENATEEDKRSPHYFEGEEDYMRFATLQQMVDYINSKPKQGEIQEPRSVEEDLDNGDKRITNYNSRGEVATVAIERDGKIVSVDSYDEGVLFEHTEYDGNGKAKSVTRYDKSGNVVGTQVYEDGKAKTPMQKLADRILDRTEEKQNAKKGAEKIEDVGEKIGGARKDIIRQYADKIKLDGKTFSTMFPKPDIDKLIEAGLPVDKVAAVKAMYDNAKREFEIMKKRRGKDKALQASLFYAMYAKNVLTGEEGNFDLAYNGYVFTEWGKEFMKANIELYKAVFNKLGADYGKVDLRSYFITPLAAGMRENFNLKKLNEENSRRQQRLAEMQGKEAPEYKDGDLINFVGEHYSRPSDQFETLEEAVNTMLERIGKEVKVGEAVQYKVESYWKRDAQGRADYTKAYLGIKVRGFGTVDVMEFKNMNEARAWLQDHREDFQQMAAAKEEQVRAEKKKPLPKYVLGHSYNEAQSQYSVFADFGKEGVRILKTFDIPQAEGVAAQAKVRSEVYKNEVLPYINSEEAVQSADGIAQEIRDAKNAKPKSITIEKKSRERVGVDWRNGKDATPEMFVDVEGKEPSVFGFRAIEFGNYVSQKERQQFLNDIYDALMDMSEILGVSPRALSLGGKLALAVGARGTSGASGHYEPYKNVINITKTRGAGVLAHEWLHALDRYFSNFDENMVYLNGTRYATQQEYADDTRQEVKDAFEKVMLAVKASDYRDRSMRLGEYWASEKELAARALQDYVIRKLEERGQKNDFLSNHVAPEEWDGDAKDYPFPLGEDVVYIGDAFDNFFATLQEKTVDGQTVLYRTSEDAEDLPRLDKHRVGSGPLTDPKMAQKATELAEKLNTPIEVRETAEGLTGKKAKAKGWYDVKSGNIVVVVSNHGSIEDIQATVLHEVVAHKGLRQMFGEHFDTFLDNVYNNVDAEIRAEIDALTEKYGNTREATEEYLASLAENTYFEKVNPSLWSRIKQWFLNMLTEAGIKLDFELSDNELRYILWRSHQRLVNPGIYNPVTRITDVAVRARLGIGEYAPAVEEMSHVAEEDAAEYANKNQDIFVSNAQRAVEGIRQNKATAEQWIAMLKKNGGLKAGEDAWLGLEEWLAERGKVKGENGKVEPITKQEILDYIAQNRIQIEEVEYEANPNSFEALKEEYEGLVRNEGFDAAQDVMFERFGDDFSIAFDDLGGELVIANEDAAATLLGSGNIINSTRLDYTTEGLENKREIALVVPTVESWNASNEIHFGDAGEGRAVAWVRFGETTDSEGNRVLVIDEIQSKRHQEGREKGYIENSEEKRKALREYRDSLLQKYNTRRLRDVEAQATTEELQRLDELDKAIIGVPSAPFEKNWHELAMKRMLRLAAEEGFDKVAWTTGEQQAERYNLGNVIDGLTAYKIFPNGYYVVPYRNGTIDRLVKIYNDIELAETFGKEIATDIVLNAENATEDNPYEIKSDGLRIGGEGMKGFYDKMLPSFVQKYTKKWGAKVGEVTMPSLEENNTMWSVDVTPEMQESVMQGQTMFRKKEKEENIVEESNKNVSLYRTEDGKVLRYEQLDLFDNERTESDIQRGAAGGTKTADNRSGTSGVQREDTTGRDIDSLNIPLRPLEKGEVSRVQRVFTKSKAFDFTAGERIESLEDVAYIFKNLEDESVENSFAVLVKDGRPIILHLGMGHYTASMVNLSATSVAVRNMNPDKIYFVHNHPSGALKASTNDLSIWNALKEAYGDIVEKGIIINLKSGKFGVFDQAESEVRPVKEGNDADIPVELFAFNKQVFDKDYNPEELYQAKSQEDVAAFISSNRLGERSKVGVLVCNPQLRVVGNVFTPFTGITSAGAKKVAEEVVYYTTIMGGTRPILFGNFPTLSRTAKSLLEQYISIYSGGSIKMADIVDIKSGESVINEPEETYGTEETRFRTVEETTDGSIDDIQTQPLTLMERITNSLLEVSAKNKENLGLRADALRAFGRDINSLLSLMKAQREYDKSTVDTLVKLAKMYFKNAQLLGEVTPYEVARIMGVLNRSVGKRDISTEAARLMDILLDAHTNALAGILDKAEKVKAKKVNAAGVEVMGRLDKYGQKRVDEYRAAKEMTPEKLEETIYDSDNRLAELEQRVREELGLPEGDVDQAARDYTGDNDVVNVYMDERARLEGLTLAREYKESIQQVQEEIKDLKRELKQAEEDYRLGNIDGKSLKEFRKSVAEAIMESKAELIEGYHSLIYKFQENTKESSKRAKAFAQAQIDRAREIQHNANSDMEGISAATQGTHPENYNNAVMNALRSPFPTLQGMLKKFGEKNVEGKGYMYERFIPQATQASDNEFRGKVTARVMIEGKLKEIHGKEMTIAKFMKQLREYGATVTYREGNEMKQFDLTKGQMLYIYMVNKMSDGQMKLRRMGITDDVVTELMTKLPEEAVQFADWAQNELLKDLRGKYNAVHERVFGAPMAAIENYFPIKIRKEARGEKGDVSEVGQEGKPSTVTGSIIKRTKNATAIDLSADAMQVLMEHIDDMEHWAAFAEFNRDLNVLLNYKHFQNQVKNMTSVRYGSGEEMWKNFKKTAQIVSGTYRPSDSSIYRAVQNIAKGLTRSKINFRFYTAAKQLLSAPAFWTDAGVEELAYCYVNPKGSFEWAKENLPGFAERWQGRTMGNEKLLKSDSDWDVWRNEFVEKATRWGMTPNAAIDALTVAQGARAVYMTKLEQFKKAGYTEQRANEKALQAAAEAYNESQQSSEGIYLSPLQVEGTVESAIFSTFKNSNFGYTRKTAQAIANIKRKMRKGYKEETIAFMTKQMIRDGLSEENAKRMAEKVYNKSKYRDVANVAMFGFGLNLLWEAGGMAIYLLFGDDDEEKEKMKKEIALRGSLGLLNGIPFGETMISAAMAVKEGDTKYFRLPELVAVSDIKNLAQVLNYDPVRGANDIVNMLVSMGVGVTPQVLTDILVAFGDVEEFSAEELGMFVARLMNAPQSNLDRLMVDDAMENSAINAEEIMRRYAEYKKSKNAPITQFFYPDEIEQKAIERYAKRFKKLLDERLENVVEDNDAYNLFYEDADARMKSTLAKMRQKYLAEDKAKVFEKLDNKELVDRVFYGKQDINEHYFGMTNAEDEDTAFIIRSVRKKLEDLKEGGKLSDKEQGLLSSLNSLNYAISRAKKLMEQEPERAQEHMTAIREMRAEAIELINKYSNE